MRLFCGLSLLSLIACNEPDFTAAKTAFGACSQTAECERNGTVCAEGVCVAPGLDWDGGAPVDVGPAVDASVSADAQDLVDAGSSVDAGRVLDVGSSDAGESMDAGGVELPNRCAQVSGGHGLTTQLGFAQSSPLWIEFWFHLSPEITLENTNRVNYICRPHLLRRIRIWS